METAGGMPRNYSAFIYRKLQLPPPDTDASDHDK